MEAYATGKTAIITGGASGIGAALARVLGESGADVVIADRQIELAEKLAVVGLSKALRAEARAHGVRVSVICPGAIRTPILTGGRYGRVGHDGISEAQILAMWERLRPMDPDRFARRALAAIAADRAIIVFPRWWKIIWYLERISPWLGLKLGEIGIEKLRSELAAMKRER